MVTASSAPPTLLLVDGHAVAYRQFFALERTNMRTRNGDASWVIYGFFSALLSVLSAYRPQAMALAFDVSRESFRTTAYPAYKAHREAMPDTMREQMTGLLSALQGLGPPLFQVPGVEADDVLGTLATQAAQQGWATLILTGDQDAFQLVDEAGLIKVLIPGRTPADPMKTYDWQAVFDKWQVWPNQVIDYKGLMGDTSDNIPGVPGIGPKTASQLLAQHPTLEAVLAHAPQHPKPGVRQKLMTHDAQARLSKHLATIVRDVPEVTFTPDACRLSQLNQAALRDSLERYELKRLLGQWPQWVSLITGEPPTYPELEAELGVTPDALAPDSTTPTAASAWLPPTLVTTLADLQQHLNACEACGVMAFDVETTGLDTLTAQPVGLSLAYQPAGGLALGQRALSQALPSLPWPCMCPWGIAI
jgi:DNA polymerase I